jgi:formylglycine-generating enzyme required for sulfatase activity
MRALVLVVAVWATASCERPPMTWTEPVTGMELVLVPAGVFVMGSDAAEPDREAQETRHHVRLSRPFYMGRYEVTQAQWRRVMGTNPSWFAQCGDDCPVESVSWQDVQRFFARLEELGSPGLRLPTEAEWERACRAGAVTAYATGAELTVEQANFDAGGTVPDAGLREAEEVPAGRPGRSPTPVGSYPPNRWGLHDLHGNVWEWTADRHCPYPGGSVTDPVGDCASELRVIRGGSWHYDADSARCALRYTHRPRDLGFSLGFRVVRDAG